MALEMGSQSHRKPIPSQVGTYGTWRRPQPTVRIRTMQKVSGGSVLLTLSDKLFTFDVKLRQTVEQPRVVIASSSV
jgi:hypothetical protein